MMALAILERLRWLEATMVAEQEEMKACRGTAKACLEKIEVKMKVTQENIMLHSHALHKNRFHR
jgi:hypothetical protein